MQPLPQPPDNDNLGLPLERVPAGTRWFRIHAAARDAVYFNTSADYRFNASHSQYGVIYLAVDVHGAFVETFCRTLGAGPPALTRGSLAQRALSEICWSEDLDLVDLTGPGLVALGLDARIANGAEYPLSQAWSAWWWSHRARPHGILYRSRHDQAQVCAALFSDRVPNSPQVQQVTSSLMDQAFEGALGLLLSRYQAALL